jgi:hypothetical protein
MPGNSAPVAVARRADRVRLERERELAEMARLMRQPGTLAEPDEPVPLHRQADTKFSTESTTTERTTTS